MVAQLVRISLLCKRPKFDSWLRNPLEKEGIGCPLWYSWASLVAQTVKTMPEMRETWVGSLGWEDPLKKGIAPSAVFLPGESPWTE